jgi:hypothetical protein
LPPAHPLVRDRLRVARLQEQQWLEETLLALHVLMWFTLVILLIVDCQAQSLRNVDRLDVVLEGSSPFYMLITAVHRVIRKRSAIRP